MEASQYAHLRARVLGAMGALSASLVPSASERSTRADGSGGAAGGNPGEGRLLRGAQGNMLAPSVVERADWCAFAIKSNTESPDAKALAEYWTRVARMEHASISSFAKASLELVQLGAPSTLLRDAHRAALDEVRHAELAFAIASEYGGAHLGPAAHALPVRLESSPVDVFRATFFDGCVQETIGAALLRLSAEAATDRRIAAILASMADDEERHVEVAFRTLAWLRRTFDACARLSPTELLAEVSAMAAPEATPYVSAARAANVASDIFDEVLRPCVFALFSVSTESLPAETGWIFQRPRVALA
ncbi:MAG: ferritin-like domain-containing protein [Polyangiaceae bacterium]